ncbi:MAG: chemotaxis response regulator protein-glutamate methylesterase [Gammaproteobacteria bacterium]|nr:MAG: chemotaxis response regulator protein-glutamate methylesterase [Gammaproteobacteria bacterium]
MSKITVLVIDDSALIRKLLTDILSSVSDIEVIGTAADPFVAREKIKKLNPDVITLDIEMPKMDGVTFLRNLMRLRPMPVVMVSTLTEKGADVTLECLSLGAVDFVTKPKLDVAEKLSDYSGELIEKVRVAAKSNVSRLEASHAAAVSRATEPTSVEKRLSVDAVISKTGWTGKIKTTDKIIAIGASTGGTEAIRAVLVDLPADIPAIVITQHIPPMFSLSFAQRLNSLCQMNVMQAEEGKQILPGNVYIAPGDKHLIVKRSGAHYYCTLNDGPPVNRHKPSVDVMYRSVLQSAGPNSLAVILTGMGNDGAQGMKELHDIGVHTIAQDQKSSVVWGMPGEAYKVGGVDNLLPLNGISEAILSQIMKMR